MLTGVPYFQFELDPTAGGEGDSVKGMVPGAQDTDVFALALKKLVRRAGYNLQGCRTPSSRL
jgi:hypothetical protein